MTTHEHTGDCLVACDVPSDAEVCADLKYELDLLLSDEGAAVAPWTTRGGEIARLRGELTRLLAVQVGDVVRWEDHGAGTVVQVFDHASGRAPLLVEAESGRQMMPFADEVEVLRRASAATVLDHLIKKPCPSCDCRPSRGEYCTC